MARLTAIRFSQGPNGPRGVEAVECAEGLLDRLLRRVVRSRAVGGDRVGGRPRGGPVAVEERARGLEGPLAGQRDQLRVRARLHLLSLRANPAGLIHPSQGLCKKVTDGATALSRSGR